VRATSCWLSGLPPSACGTPSGTAPSPLPRAGQTQVEATRERLEEELGITPDQYENLRVTDRFEYKRYFENAGVEYEVCAVLQATLTDTSLDPNPEEVDGLLWVPYRRLHENPEYYRQLRLCPWFEIAMRRDFEE